MAIPWIFIRWDYFVVNRKNIWWSIAIYSMVECLPRMHDPTVAHVFGVYHTAPVALNIHLIHFQGTNSQWFLNICHCLHHSECYSSIVIPLLFHFSEFNFGKWIIWKCITSLFLYVCPIFIVRNKNHGRYDAIQVYNFITFLFWLFSFFFGWCGEFTIAPLLLPSHKLADFTAGSRNCSSSVYYFC